MEDIFEIVDHGTSKIIGDSKARTNIAPTFDVNKANAVGDLVLSDTGILYKFNAAYTAGTSWNSRTSKEQVNLVNELNNTVKKSGDDMTGSLQLYPGNGSNINFFDSRMSGFSDADSSSEKWLKQISFYDKNSKERSYIRQADLALGQGVQLETTRQISNGSTIYNGITFLIKADGTRVTRFTDAPSFRNGMSAAQRSDLGIVEDTNTATHTISAGQYVIWKGNLYIANAAISSGTALTTSNLTAVNNGGLNAIDAKIHGNIPQTLYRPLTANQTSNWSYTVPHTGTLYLCFISLVRSYIGITWNGNTIMNLALTSATNAQANTVTIRVKKGDIIGVVNLTTDCWLAATVTSLIADAYEPVQ